MMIWRFWGWLMVVYVAIGGLAVSAFIATIGFTRPGSRIDWSIVPGQAVLPLWIADSLAGFAGFVVAAIPAPIGFSGALADLRRELRC